MTDVPKQQNKSDMVEVKKVGLLWAERVWKKKKSLESELDSKEDIFVNIRQYLSVFVNICRAMDVPKQNMVEVKKVGLLWAERVRKKKKSLERELDSKKEEDLFEKSQNSAEVPVCFSEGRRVSV